MATIKRVPDPLSVTNPELVDEWDYDKNLLLTPDFVSPGSSLKVWWKCSKGHSWLSIINHRASRGDGCPYCSGHIVIKGETDLKSTNPDLAQEWNYEKNGALTPESVKASSHQKVWWKCKVGHEWESIVSSRTRGTGCPYCSNKKVLKGYNDLLSVLPNIAKEWDYEKNAGLLPDEVLYGSHLKVWWKCAHGHAWQADIKSRKNGSGCPYCSGLYVITGENDLQTTNPDLAKEWDNQKNGTLMPSMVKSGSSVKVWWVCSNCRNSWKTSVSNRAIKGRGCPKCGIAKQVVNMRKNISHSGESLLETHSQLCKEWNYDKNVGISPIEFTSGSRKKVWWRCTRGHEWQSVISSRVNGRGCPVCSSGISTSLPEKAIVFYLKKNNVAVVENAKVFGDSNREVDVYIPDYNTAIEYDGQYWHKDRSKDIEKTILCKDLGIKLIRIREPQIGKLNDGYSVERLTEKPRSRLDYMNSTIVWLLNYLGLESRDVDSYRDTPRIRAMIEKNYEEDSFGLNFPEIAREWDFQRNAGLKPNDLSKGSNISVWWICKENHSWQDSIVHRISGRGCPFCSGRRTLSGYNDFKTVFPDLADEWDFEKNNGIDPSQISSRNHLKVWWKCPKGHSYFASISHRTDRDGRGCPYCSNKKVLSGYNDFLSRCPEAAKEWDYDKNGELRPENVLFGSHKNVWWRCDKGHEWEAIIYIRKDGHNCPYCTNIKAMEGYNDLQTVNHELAEEWDTERNGILLPTTVTVNSNKVVWWKCKFGHEWKATVCHRNKGSGCPYCSGRYAIKGVTDLATTNPDLLKEWDFEKNINISPENVKSGSSYKVWWRCGQGHEWKAAIYSRAKGHGCPICNVNKRVRRENNGIEL